MGREKVRPAERLRFVDGIDQAEGRLGLGREGSLFGKWVKALGLWDQSCWSDGPRQDVSRATGPRITRQAHTDAAVTKKKKKKSGVNKNTLANTDTGITQAFNKLFVQVKVDCRPLRRQEGQRVDGEATKGRSWGMQGYKGNGDTDWNKEFYNRHDRWFLPSFTFSKLPVWLLLCQTRVPLPT